MLTETARQFSVAIIRRWALAAALALFAAATLITAAPAATAVPTAQAQDAPSPPGYAFLLVGNGTLTVSWMPVSGATKYELHYSSDNGGSWINHANNLTSTRVTINGVDYTKAYVGRVRAGNANGWSGWKATNPAGPWSTDRVVTTPINEDSKNKLKNAQEAARKSTGEDHHGQPSSDPTPAPLLTVTAITATTATLNLANNTSSWTYRESPSGTCSSAQSGSTTTASLTGLTGATDYTYNTYASTNCSGAVMAFAHFSTLRSVTLTASNVTSSSATLNISNYSGTWYSMRIHPTTPAAVCSIGVSGASQNRDSLTSNTTYAYTAYSDVNCTAINALDTAYFSTTDAFVGNLAEAPHDTNWTIGGASNTKATNAFTTGSQSLGYTLTGVTLSFAARTSNPGNISVALHAADTSNSSNPAATAAATLSGANPGVAGLYTYTCSTGCSLSASAKYFIVMSVPTGYANGSYNLRNTRSNDESPYPSGSGWNIGNAARTKVGTNPWSTAVRAAHMHVAANVKPPTLTASSITSTGATLTIANHTGNWYHKETFPSTTATCSTVNANATATLSNLTANKTYAFTAYSVSACSAASALATAYFSTTDDGVGNLNEETDFNITVGRGGSNNQSVTSPFATGSVASHLESVTLRFGNKSATGTPGNIQVTLHEPDTSNSSNPSSTTKATLTGSNPDTAGLYTYTCSSGCYLEPDSTYFVKVAAPSAAGAGAYSLSLTQSDDEINHPAANGWSIGNQGRHMSQRFPWSGHALGRVASMHVAGNDPATLAASSVGATKATLTIGGHTGQWWYKADKSPHTTCQGPVASGTSTRDLTGLTAGEDYVYSAYDATGCADANLIAVAAAFTTSVTVSNLDGTDSSVDFTLGTYAQGFTTGSASDYTLLSATVDIDTAHSSISVSIRAAQNNGKPATTNRATLTGVPAIGEVAFTCDASNSGNDCSLARNTTYFIVVTGSSAYLDTTDSNAQTLQPSGNGWSIEDAARQGSTFDLDSNGRALMIKVEAKPQATLSAGSITNLGATLTMKHHTGDWWFKADKGYYSGDCEGVSGTTRTLPNYLAKATTYVFTAYSDSACSTANALDSATFTTTGTALSVSSVTGTGATLNIAGHTAAWWYDADSGPDTVCQSVAANTSSDTLTGLTAGSAYTYTAYSKTGCNAVDELDDVTFSTSDVSVGNLGELSDSDDCVIGFSGGSGGNSLKCATSFTTGSHSAGYTLKSVTGLFDAKFRGPDDIIVAIHAADTANSSHPAASASITLTGSDPDTAGLYTYSCSTGCALAASATYFVVMSTADSGPLRQTYAWQQTTSNYETVRPSTATGWAIANAGLQDTGSGWTTPARPATGVMLVAADKAPPTLTVGSITTTGATLTIANHTAAWHYKATTGPHTTCQGPVTANTSTKALTGLTEGTTYVYSAYSDSGCTTANLLATASSFTTAVSVSNLSKTATTGGANLYSAYPRLAQAFTTGSDSGGYTLDKVTVHLQVGSSQTLTVTLHNAASNGNDPSGSALVTLASGAYATGEHTFSCSGSACDLDADTTYVIQLAAGGGLSTAYYWRRISTKDEDQQPNNNGWSIGDRSRYYRASDSTWYDETGGSFANALKLTARAHPSLTASAVTTTRATLTIANHADAWYYKATSSPHTTCQGPVAAGTSTATLTGLTAGASYTYSAYSDSACSTLVATAPEYTASVHVTNLHSPSHPSPGSTISSSIQQGVAFTTGSNPGGYTLGSVTISMKKGGTPTPSNLAITLHSMAGANPYDSAYSYPSSTALATLTGTPPTSTSYTDTMFTCSGSGCDLDPGTTYFVVATYTGASGQYEWRYDGSDIQSGSPPDNGWKIERSHQKPSDGSWSSWGDWHIVRADFTIKPSLTASAVTATTATLTIGYHWDAWYYKATSGPHTTCQGPVAAGTSTTTLTGLTTGASYTYSAYSDSACSTLVATAPQYTASALTVGSITTTGATLTLGNHNGAWYYQSVGGVSSPNWPPVGSPPPYQEAGGASAQGAGIASAQGASTNPNCQGPVNGAQANIDGSPGNSLVPGSKYTFTAYDNANCQGAGIASAQANSQSNAPAAPTGLVGHRGYGMVDAEWPHVTGATGYNVEIYWWYIGYGWHRSGSDVTGGTESTRTHRITTTGSTRTPAWMGVPNHGLVIIAVQSVNANGTSGWTYSGFIDPVDFPRYPQNVTAARDATGDTAGQITVNWGQCAPSADWCNGGTPITGYSVSASSDNGASWTKVVEAKTVSTPSASLSFCADHNESWLVSVGVTNRLGTVYSDNIPVGRYAPTPGSRNACLDFDTLSAAGNTSPDGIWSDGTTMWVSNSADTKAYAYNLATKARDAAKDISFSGSTLRHITLASDGTTMWTSDLLDKSKLFAYSVSGRSRDASKDITLHADNSGTYALWTNGATIWVGDDTDTYIYAYTIANSARDTSKEIDLHSDNGSLDALWSDGVTMWVADADDDKLYAYKMSDGSRDAAKDYTDLDSQNDDPFGSWSDGTTMWVANNAESNPAYEKLFAYNTIVPFTSPTTVNAYRGFNFLDAEWSAGPGASSYDVEHYHPYNLARHGVAWRRVGSGVSGTSLRVSGVKNWGGDIIRVRSISPQGDASEWSYSASVDAISSLPRAPQGLSVTRASNTSLSLSWTQCDVSQVRCHGGTPITGYLVELSNDGGKNWRSGGKIAAPYVSGSTMTVTQGVNTGVNRVRVSAETRFRNSGWTAVAVSPTFIVSNVAATSATLTLFGHATAWRYKADTGPHTTCQAEVAAGTSTATLTGLTGNTSYTYSAYSDATCSTLIVTAASFTTPYAHVTNLATTSSGDSNINSSRQQGVDFTTGSNSGGYTLESVTIPLREKTAGAGALAITLHEQTGSAPSSTTLATLTLSGTAPTSTYANTVFTCSGAGCELGDGKTYYIVATLTGTGEYAMQFSAVQEVESTDPSDSGWDIGVSHFKNTGQDWSSWNDLHLIRIDFTIKPSLTASAVTTTTATLNIAHHGGDAWYYKATSGPHTTCQGPVAAGTTTKSLTGLTANTSYTYSAYSDSTCSTLIATADSFTLGLTVGSITSTGATLTIAGHTGTWYYKEIHPTAGTCASESTTSKNLTLTANNTYAYTAYSSAGCTAANALNTVYFSTADAYVGNLDEALSIADATVGNTMTLMVQRAVAFDTGNATHGYTLKGVTLRFAATTGSPANIVVAVHDPASAGSSDPKATALVTLSGATQPGAGLHTFACSGSGCDLDRNATYFIVVSAPGSPLDGYHSLRGAASGGETPYPAGSGWSIADTGRFKHGSNAWAAPGNGDTVVMHLAAEEVVPSLTVSNIAATTATLTIAGHSGNWYYKHTNTGATCDGPVSGTTKNLTGLTAGTSYTYSAYTATGCGASNLLVTASSFTTPALTVSSITATTATLTIAGHSGNWYYKHTNTGATCDGPVSETTKNLTGLTPGTSYTYSAYSDSTCTATNLLATAAAFTTGGVSVSNMSETSSGYHSVGGFNRAASFTTGANSGGYTLNSVTIKFDVKNGSPNDIAVRIYSDSSGSPGSEVANLTLTGPASPDNEDATYTCSGSGCSLSAGATYHIHLSRPGNTGSYRWSKTTSDTETNAPSNAGWLIGNNGHHQTVGANYWTSSPEVGMFKVAATLPPPTLTASNVGTTTATLTRANHIGNWRYKYTTPATPAGTCSASQSGASANVTGLTAGTTYVFKLYAGTDSACATPLATASSFTTAVSVSNMNETANSYHSVGGFNRAASFTTGANSGGYTLNSVTIKFDDKNGSPNDIAVRIYSDSSGSPGSEVANLTLTGPARPDNEDATYTCSGSGCSLSAGATYHIHLSRPGNTGSYRWSKTTSDTETNAPSNAGWLIGNSGNYQTVGSSYWTSQGEVGMFTVVATEK